MVVLCVLNLKSSAPTLPGLQPDQFMRDMTPPPPVVDPIETDFSRVLKQESLPPRGVQGGRPTSGPQPPPPAPPGAGKPSVAVRVVGTVLAAVTIEGVVGPMVQKKPSKESQMCKTERCQ